MCTLNSMLALQLNFILWIISYISGLLYGVFDSRNIHGIYGSVSSLCYVVPFIALSVKNNNVTILQGATSVIALNLVYISGQAHFAGFRYWSWTHDDRVRYNNAAGNKITEYDMLSMLNVAIVSSALYVDVAINLLKLNWYKRQISKFYLIVITFAVHAHVLHDENVPIGESDKPMTWMIVLCAVAGIAAVTIFCNVQNFHFRVDFGCTMINAMITTFAYLHVRSRDNWSPGEPHYLDVVSVAWHANTNLVLCTIVLMTTFGYKFAEEKYRVAYHVLNFMVSCLQWLVFYISVEILAITSCFLLTLGFLLTLFRTPVVSNGRCATSVVSCQKKCTIEKPRRSSHKILKNKTTRYTIKSQGNINLILQHRKLKIQPKQYNTSNKELGTKRVVKNLK